MLVLRVEVANVFEELFTMLLHLVRKLVKKLLPLRICFLERLGFIGGLRDLVQYLWLDIAPEEEAGDELADGL